MIELVGLKRFEFNAMILFTGVTHANFYSLFRRALVVLYKCKVYDKRYIEKNVGPNAAARGIFPRDPMLKKKLGAPGAGAVMVKLLRAFMEGNDSEQSVQLMEDYAMNGLDGGATKAELLKACGLQPELTPQTEEKAPTVGGTPSGHVPAGDLELVRQAPMLREAKAVTTFMLDMGLDRITASDVARIKALTKVPNGTAFLDSLVVHRHLQKFVRPHQPQHGRAYGKTQKSSYVKKRTTTDLTEKKDDGPVVAKDENFYIPVVHTKHQYKVLIPEKERDLDVTFPEMHTVAGARHLVTNSNLLAQNATVMYDKASEDTRKLRSAKGRKGSAKYEGVRVLEEEEDKLMHQRDAISKLTLELSDKLAEVDGSDAGGVHDSVVLNRSYFQKHGRSRAYVVGSSGAQSEPMWCQELLHPESEDWDQGCAMAKILAQIVTRLVVTTNLPECRFETLKAIATDRLLWSEVALGKPEEHGKEIVNSTLAGKQVHDEDIACKPAVKMLTRESRVLRWLAVSLRPKLFAKFLNDGKSWPENTTFFYMWSPVEDYITEVASDKLLQREVKHLSLHFDGIRVATAGDKVNPKTRKEDLEQHVFKTTGYVAVFNLKAHRTFLEWGATVGKKFVAKPVSASQRKADELAKPGNGIPFALSSMFPAKAKEIAELAATHPPVQQSEGGMLVRSYTDWCAPNGSQFNIEVSEALPITDCHFLMHVGGKGSPHCVCVQSLDAGTRYVIKDPNGAFELKGVVINSLYRKCLDCKSIVFFTVSLTPSLADSAPVLLKLSAQ
jgi:hypothetical protein